MENVSESTRTLHYMWHNILETCPIEIELQAKDKKWWMNNPNFQHNQTKELLQAQTY